MGSSSRIIIKKSERPSDRQTKFMISRNPFFNFMHKHRCENPTDRNQAKIAEICASKWKRMSEEEKLPFILLSRKMPKKRKILIDRTTKLENNYNYFY